MIKIDIVIIFRHNNNYVDLHSHLYLFTCFSRKQQGRRRLGQLGARRELFQGMDAGSDADRLFKELDGMLEREVDSKFFIDPKIYKSLVDVVEIVNTSTHSLLSQYIS